MNFDMWIRALKAARARAEVSQERLAVLVRYSPSTVAAIETGRRRPTMEFAVAADEALETAGLLAELLDLANRQQSPTWFAPWRSAEATATMLRTFQPLLVPGLLQTEEYARAVLTGGGLHTAEGVERFVATRIDRQALLTGDAPKLFVAVLDEMALRRVVGGRDVQRAQLQHLIAMAAQPHIRLHVIPFEAGAHAGMSGGFVLATMPEGDDVAHVDGVFGQLMDRPDAVGIVVRTWDALLGEALPEHASLALIEKLVSEL